MAIIMPMIAAHNPNILSSVIAGSHDSYSKTGHFVIKGQSLLCSIIIGASGLTPHSGFFWQTGYVGHGGGHGINYTDGQVILCSK